MTTKPLTDQIALVTGASRGIGAASAEALAAAGAHVILTARTVDGLEAVEDRIHASGGTATIAPLDLTDPESIGRLATAVSERWKKLDMLVLNAAMLGTLAPVQYLDAAEFAKIFTLNVSAQAAMIAAFDPLLRQSDGARIIGVTSSVGRNPRAYWGAYGASKAAFETLLDAYGEENKATGRIRIAILDPGATRTKMRAAAYPGEDPNSLKDPSIVAARIAALMIEGFETGQRERVNSIS
jgi:NAD(P)-dependent dehydrogenase (short-subunit alcohol dehydrogenase family)